MIHTTPAGFTLTAIRFPWSTAIVSNHARSAIGGLRTSSDTHPVMQQMFRQVHHLQQHCRCCRLGCGRCDAPSNWFYNCCVGTFVLPEQQGNLTDHPAFVNPDPARSRLPSAARPPCINGGTNHPWIADLDLDGVSGLTGLGVSRTWGVLNILPPAARTS